MKTELRDVLHLYLGCKVAIADEQYKGSSLDLKGIEDNVCRVRDEGIKLTFSVNNEHVKPILRPLSDLTEDEKRYFKKLFFDLKEKENMPGVTSINIYAKMTTEYLKRGFDLFELIESGQAIDKQKVK